jgi:hypothetical protein
MFQTVWKLKLENVILLAGFGQAKRVYEEPRVETKIFYSHFRVNIWKWRKKLLNLSASCGTKYYFWLHDIFAHYRGNFAKIFVSAKTNNLTKLDKSKCTRQLKKILGLQKLQLLSWKQNFAKLAESSHFRENGKRYFRFNPKSAPPCEQEELSRHSSNWQRSTRSQTGGDYDEGLIPARDGISQA